MLSKKSPQLRFKGFTDDWEDRNIKDILREFSTKSKIENEYRVLSSTNVGMEFRDGRVSGTSNLGYKIIKNGDLVLSPQNLWLGNININNIGTGLVSPSYKTFNFTDIDSSFIKPQLRTPKMLEEYKNSSTQGASVVRRNLEIDSFYQIKIATPSIKEQEKIGSFFKHLDSTISLHQRKLDLLKEQKKGYLQKMFPKNGEKVPELRFAGFADDWEDRELGEEFKKVSERNDGSFGRDHWISVAKMYFQSPEKVQSNNIDTRTYVMREGDIAFEGHPNSEFKFGRFVANDIGAGVVSELFPIYKHQHEYDNNYWKNAIQIERIMAPIFAKSITSSGNSSNKLDTKHFLRQKILIPQINEQKKMGSFFKQLDNTIALHQRKLDLLKEQKKGLLQKMFV